MDPFSQLPDRSQYSVRILGRSVKLCQTRGAVTYEYDRKLLRNALYEAGQMNKASREKVAANTKRYLKSL